MAPVLGFEHPQALRLPLLRLSFSIAQLRSKPAPKANPLFLSASNWYTCVIPNDASPSSSMTKTKGTSEISTAAAPSKAERSLPESYPSDDMREKALKLFRAGLGYKSVARTLGLSVYTVRDWSRQFKAGRFMPTRADNQYRYDDEIKKRVVALRAQGLSWRKIESQTGVNISSCRTWCKADAGLDEAADLTQDDEAPAERKEAQGVPPQPAAKDS